MKSTEFNLSTALHLAFVQWNGDECTPFDKLLYGEEKCGEWCLKSTKLCVGCSARLNMCRAALSYSIVTCSNIGWLSLDFFLTKISKLGNLNCIHDFKGELQHYKNAGKKKLSRCVHEPHIIPLHAVIAHALLRSPLLCTAYGVIDPNDSHRCHSFVIVSYSQAKGHAHTHIPPFF